MGLDIQPRSTSFGGLRPQSPENNRSPPLLVPVKLSFSQNSPLTYGETQPFFSAKNIFVQFSPRFHLLIHFVTDFQKGPLFSCRRYRNGLIAANQNQAAVSLPPSPMEKRDDFSRQKINFPGVFYLK